MQEIWQTAKRKLDLSKRPLIMGIVNVTPDSFYDGGRYADPSRAVEHALRLCEEGADILDVGGESTRPGSEAVEENDERRRVVPVIEQLAARVDVPISVDTRKAGVAEAALKSGAEIINDISGCTADPRMSELAAASGTGLVLMHIQGEPKTMQLRPVYNDVVEDIIKELEERIRNVKAVGVREEQIVIDPGIGFGKTLAHNLEILRRLQEFSVLERPLLIGPSRKSFIGRILDLPPEDRLEGTLSAVSIAVLYGARIVRVHDVQAAARSARVADAVAGRLDISGL